MNAAPAAAPTPAHPGTEFRIPYRPFVDPLEMHGSWWALIVPLSLGIAVVYKAVRMRDLSGYWRAVVIMTLQIVLGMLLLAVASFALIEVYARFMAERAP